MVRAIVEGGQTRLASSFLFRWLIGRAVVDGPTGNTVCSGIAARPRVCSRCLPAWASFLISEECMQQVKTFGLAGATGADRARSTVLRATLESSEE